MKNIRTIFIGGMFLLGIPISLVLYDFSAPQLFLNIAALQEFMDLDLAIRTAAAVVLWVVWGVGIVSVIHEAIWFIQHGESSTREHIFRHAAATFVVALWLLFSQQRAINPVDVSQRQVEVVVEGDSSREIVQKQSSRLQLAYTFSALFAVYEARSRRRLQESHHHLSAEQMSKKSQIIWSSLKFHHIATKMEPIAVLHTSNENVHGYLPIGMMSNQIVFFAASLDDAISVVGEDEELTADFCRYLRCVMSAHGMKLSLVNGVDRHLATVHIEQQGTQWVINPGSTAFVPFWIPTKEADQCDELVRELSRPLKNEPPRSLEIEADSWSVCVRIMGPVEIINREWKTIHFDKSKSAELLAWLVLHRDRPTRVAARTALWEMSVQDSTFNNVVSGVRKAINNEDTNLLTRDNHDVLRIGPEVTTDHEMLLRAVLRAKQDQSEEAYDEVRSALNLVRDLPFAGQDFVWADTEGITSNVVLTIVTGATMLAEFNMNKNDIDGVFWATGQGLKALRGHEALIALRMRAHAQQHNVSGVNAEWQAYERVRMAEDRFMDRRTNEIAKLRNHLIAAR